LPAKSSFASPVFTTEKTFFPPSGKNLRYLPTLTKICPPKLKSFQLEQWKGEPFRPFKVIQGH